MLHHILACRSKTKLKHYSNQTYMTPLYIRRLKAFRHDLLFQKNEWMMSNADLIIAFVAHNYGGAYASLQVAKRKGKKIMNIYDLLKEK